MPDTSAKDDPPAPIEMFGYLDYRSFLRDYYLDRKDRRGLSFRAFSRRAGLRSPNYLKLVIDGARNLSDEMAARFATAVGLKGDAAAYFGELVRFNQAKTTPERNDSYARLTGYRHYRRAQPLELAHAAYHSTWYLPAIRELAARRDFRDDPAWVARALLPSITKAEAAAGLQTLIELGLLVRDPEGRVVQGEPLVSTGSETRGLHIRNYHRTMMERAGHSMDEVPASERDISSLTLCLSKDGLSLLKQRIQRFRRELLELATLEEDPAQVVQVNFQLFPLSRPRGEEGR
jgi:uncharacterized protein (TIGR02147 family)